MSIFLLFLSVGILAILLVIQYDKQNRKKVDVILRANKNVPPLFMLRSAELKVNAIKAALSSMADDDAEKTKAQLEKLMNGYKHREIPLATYYSKLGALLISVNNLKGIPVEA